MDVKKVCSSVVSKFSQLKTKLTVAAVCCTTALLGGSAFAVPGDVAVAIPDINYGGVATSVLTALTPGIVAAIGLGLSIWGVTFIYRKFKQMGK